jgi:hypothetical protein
MTRRFIRLATVLTVVLVLAPLASAAPGGIEEVPIIPGEVQGTTARVIPFKNPFAGPVAFISANHGSGNFIVRLEGNGRDDLLINTIGNYQGFAVDPFLPRGSYRLVVQSDGRWAGSLSALVTEGINEPGLNGTFSYHGDFYRQIQTRSVSDPVVTARCACRGNFVVHIYDYRGHEDLLFNEIGRYHGQTVLDSPLRAGRYIVVVEADGPWTLSFK